MSLTTYRAVSAARAHLARGVPLETAVRLAADHYGIKPAPLLPRVAVAEIECLRARAILAQGVDEL